MDPLDLAQASILRVAHIASELGAQFKRPVCGRLGAELLLVADYLDTAGLDQEERLRLRISKLLRDVEMICSWPHRISGTNYPLLETICQPSSGTQYVKTRARIQQGLDNITVNTNTAEDAIRHIQKFTARNKRTYRETKEDTTTRKSRPAEHPTDVNVRAHSVLQEHMCCTCQDGIIHEARGSHLVRLLLRPPSRNPDNACLAQFDMLFSSSPWWNGSRFSRWQDVQVVVPWARKTSRKYARFVGEPHERTGTPTRLTRIDQGQFCRLISLEADSRLCLTIQDRELQKSGFEPLKQLVEHAPGMSLAEILSIYHLTPKMKLALAYILAYSVWQYYDSDWMKTGWTSQTIQFMKEHGGNTREERGKLFAWKPYLSVRFGDEDADSAEFSSLDGQIHPYPRIRSLGIMLVEIGIGFPLPRTKPGINEDYLLALEYSKDERLWRDCDYPDYISAVNHCLDPGTFNLAHSTLGQGRKELMEGLKQRRNILYDKVVFPIEDLLQGTKWLEQLTAIAPLEAPAKAAATQFFPVDIEEAAQPSAVRKATKSPLTKPQKEAKYWLARMRHFNHELSRSALPVAPVRVRLAVLDTGCNDNAPFFLSPENDFRLREWKDFVDDANHFEDCHGHGTHLTSLIMKIAPQAEIYVARVAKDPKDILGASENVAQAIDWATTEWKADIVSMSFGYTDDQPNISRAIRKAMYERDGSILFFAAASNSGANDKEMFPARHESVISIRATNANGDFTDFNPPRSPTEDIVFGTLGVDVPSAGLSDSGEEVYKSGTSVATAVAVGIAGALLGYINAKKDISEKVRTRQGMQAVFRALASKTLNDHCLYLTPWPLMGQVDQTRLAILLAALANM
ncbi:hypothetical protein BDV36DRAFT_274502 [Aspergillus pseudocaelatus]|uniref:Peptidase S8/S53 domain-containing protein n=1 Tax=Aspergillus pseudocaelatus TaxID=1825620 RepID=A0ABQ6W2W1_9EURO|nr:hypothetical protein BDV36DRAFT_274502 [Aspergillus pseudocaelatus]